MTGHVIAVCVQPWLGLSHVIGHVIDVCVCITRVRVRVRVKSRDRSRD